MREHLVSTKTQDPVFQGRRWMLGTCNMQLDPSIRRHREENHHMKPEA